jgi:hypothetical protein
MSAVQLIFVPVPVAGQVYNRRSSPPVYPYQPRPRPYPPNQGPPPSRDPAIRRMLDAARKDIATFRRSPDFVRRGLPAGL